MHETAMDCASSLATALYRNARGRANPCTSVYHTVLSTTDQSGQLSDFFAECTGFVWDLEKQAKVRSGC